MFPHAPSSTARRFVALTLLVGALVQAPLSARETPATPTSAASTGDAALVEALDTAFAATYPADSPGASVLVRRGDTVLLKRGYGSASLELDVPLAPESVFRIGSVTKQFTAVGILMLIEDGKLRLDQTLAEALPDYPGEHATQVTIEHLLTHTSGIPSYTDDADFWPNARDDHSHDEMFAYFADDALQFDPGSAWKYNNSGYYLLGAIIETASGTSYGDFLRQRIFRPLGMSSTFVDEPGRLIRHRVQGYQPDPTSGFRTAEPISMTCPGAAGAMVSTVEDLDRWNRALDGETLVPRKWLDRAWTPYRLSTGEATDYGYGWLVGTHHGVDGRAHRVIEHGGGIHGFTTHALRLPDDQIFVTVLSNGHPSPPNRATRIAASLVLGEDPDPAPVDVAPAVLDRYVGVYRSEDGTERAVTVD
ncbi:MAG: serine hydrolase domain-containing protein, partial [Acidobacteriota bacterium]